MDTTLKLSETKAFSKCQQVQWYAVLCNSIIMGVHLHVWVAWNKNQNKGAFTVPAPSFRDVMNRIVFFFCFFFEEFHFLVRVPVSESSHGVFILWGSNVSTGNAAGCVFTAIYRHKRVFVIVLWAASWMWLPGKREETSFAKSWLEIWEWKHWPKHLPWVRLSVGLCLFGPFAPRPAQMTFKISARRLEMAEKWSVSNVPVYVKTHTNRSPLFWGSVFSLGKPFQFKSPSRPLFS